MFGPKNRILRGWIAIGLVVFASQVQAASLCLANTIGVSSGALFSSFGTGTVVAQDASGGSASACPATFYNAAQVNTLAGDYYAPSGSSACSALSGSTSVAITTTGTSGSAMDLPAFGTSSSTYAYAFNSGSSAITAGGATAAEVLLLPYTISMGGRSITVPAYGTSPATLPSATYSDWGAVSVSGASSLAIQANATDVHISSLNLSNCSGSSGVTFAPGNYYIGSMSVGAGCSVGVNGSGVVNLYVNSALSMTSGSCWNWGATCTSAATSATVAQKTPANLRIWALNGVSVLGTTKGAGALYSAAGIANLGLTATGAWVGEVAAPNITFSGVSGVVYDYVSTGAFTGAAVVRNGVYGLSAPAVPPLMNTGDYAYFAQQQDIDSSGNSNAGGHLYAYAINADGSLAATPAWDAAQMMTLTGRTASLVTDIATGGLSSLSSVANNLTVLIGSLLTTLLSNGYNAIEGLLNPNWQGGMWLAGRDPTDLMGRPSTTAPVLATKAVIVGTDDGFLYAFNRTSGALMWGYYPSDNLPSALTAGLVQSSTPWGQLAVYTVNGTEYVAATGMQGALHLVLKLNADDSLAGLAWKDYRSGQSSPASPVGGAAPTMAVDQTGSAAGKVAYIVGNTLVRRALVDGTGAVSTTLSATATSNVVYVNDSAAYYGDALGNIDGALGASNALSLGETVASPVLFLNGAYQGSTLSLLGTSKTKAALMTQSSTGKWTTAWSYSGTSTGTTPSLPTQGTITAMPTITNSLVLVPYSTGSNVCAQSGYAAGPLALASGAPQLSLTTLRTLNMTASINALGAGGAVYAAPTLLNNKVFIMGDTTGGSTTTQASTWSPYTFRTSSSSGTNQRQAWRELTSFMPSSNSTSSH